MTIIEGKTMNITRRDLDAGRVDLADAADPAIAPRAPIPPGILLRDEWLDPLKITPYRLAREIGVPPNRLNAIIAGTRAISADTALRLARFFGTDAQSWMNLQTAYDLARERQANGETIAKTIRPLQPA